MAGATLGRKRAKAFSGSRLGLEEAEDHLGGKLPRSGFVLVQEIGRSCGKYGEDLKDEAVKLLAREFSLAGSPGADDTS